MKLPIHESSVSFEAWYAGTDREIRGKALSDIDGKAKVGFGLMELPAGSNTKPGHLPLKDFFYSRAGRHQCLSHSCHGRFSLVATQPKWYCTAPPQAIID